MTTQFQVGQSYATRRRYDTILVRYFADETEAYWTEQFDEGYPCAFSANRYATFFGLDLANGRQVPGFHSTPLDNSDPRRYFLRRPGFARTNFTFEIVDSIDDLAA